MNLASSVFPPHDAGQLYLPDFHPEGGLHPVPQLFEYEQFGAHSQNEVVSVLSNNTAAAPPVESLGDYQELTNVTIPVKEESRSSRSDSSIRQSINWMTPENAQSGFEPSKFPLSV